MKMYCKDDLNSIIKEGEGNDSNEIAKCMVNKVVNSTFKSPLPKSTVLNPKRRSTAGNKYLYFKLQTRLGKRVLLT